MPPKKLLISNVTESPPLIQETPSSTSYPGTKRSIGMNGVIQQLGVNTTFSREQGTPQERLHDLLDACKKIVTNNSTIFKGKITKLHVQGLIGDLKIASREDMFKSTADRNLFCEYIDLFITSLKSTPDQITKNKILITVWLLVLVKSMSDISQCGSLINDIPKLYEDNNIPNIEKSSAITGTNVPSVLNSNKNVTFVSSDKICAALSTNILKLIDYPVQTLCSRKTGTTTQTMIIQKGEVSALSVVLSLAGDNEKTMGLINDVIYYGNPDIDKDAVANMITSIHSFVTEYYTKLITEYNLQNNIVDYATQDIIQLEVDKLFFYKDQVAQTKLCKLISEISSILNLKDNLLGLSYVLSSKDNMVVPRWTYHVSNDVFKYMFPLTQTMFTDLKSKISREEILSATADAMYGHDFALSCITDLGREFLNAIGKVDVYEIDEDIPYSKKEDLCISQTLQLNNFSTINQHGNKFSINFNSDFNYLVVDRKKMFYRISEIPWHITASPLVEQPIIASVDFVSGEPSISVALSEQVNFLKQQNIRSEQVLAFSTISNESRDLKTKLDAIKDNTSYEEYYGVTTLYDGAAPYGGLPVYQLDPYESSMDITLKPSGKQKGGEENFNLKVLTETTETPDILTEKWSSDRIDVIAVDYFNNTLIPNVVPPLSEEQKGQLSNPQDTSPLYKFNLIWGTILNSKSNLTQQFRREFYDEFKIVVGEIQKKNRQEREKVAERPRRASTQQPISRFEDYKIFDNDSIRSVVEKIYGAVSENDSPVLQNFDVIMIEYIKILFLNDTNDDTKYGLLKILESAVRGVCSEDPDGMFKSLVSNNTVNEEISMDEKLNKIISDSKKKIDRDQHIQSMKQIYLQEISKKQGKSKNTIELSGEVVTPIKNYEQPIPGSEKSVRSAPAALSLHKSGRGMGRYEEDPSQTTSDLTQTQGDNTLSGERSNPSFEIDSPVVSDALSRQGSETTDYGGHDTDESDTLVPDLIQSDSPPLTPSSNTRRLSDMYNSGDSISFGEHPRRYFKTSDSSDDENIVVASQYSIGGSRKHHRTPHNSVTRRKNQKFPKRKTIKKIKMPKRRNNTRRNK